MGGGKHPAYPFYLRTFFPSFWGIGVGATGLLPNTSSFSSSRLSLPGCGSHRSRGGVASMIRLFLSGGDCREHDAEAKQGHEQNSQLCLDAAFFFFVILKSIGFPSFSQ
jgi:hypothetical protein